MATPKDLLIERLNLLPHPEGGFYNQTYVSAEQYPTDRGLRPASTAILFLVTQGSFSALHRIKSDEIWHFHQGSPLRIVVITEDGERQDQVLGNDILKGEAPQFVVPAGAWFGAVLEGDQEGQLSADDYALVGCTVSPGFVFEDFELAFADKLSEKFPEHGEIIQRMTRQ